MTREEAIQNIKKAIGFSDTLDESIFTLFPELKEKESEDETHRKWILEYLYDGLRKSDEQFKEQFKSAIAWLENLGNMDIETYKNAEKEKYDFVSGQFIECRKSFNEFKEGNSYWFEYVGNDTYIGRSDNILNKKFHITPRQLYRLFTQEHCPKEDSVSDGTNAPTGYGKYVDECLNEASKHFFSEGEDKYSVADLFYAGVRCGQTWLEKQRNSVKECLNLPHFTFDDVLALQCCMETVKKVQKDEKLYEALLLLHDKVHDAYHLEKQKEQKPLKWSEDIIRKGIKEVGLTQYQINWLKNNVFPPKEEQKPEVKLKGWVARDRDEEIWVYRDHPEKDFEIQEWMPSGSRGTMLLDQKSFPDLKWEDEPVEIEITIKRR